MNSLKIEIGAILSLRNIILKHPLLNDYINDNDKEPSWDGFIYLYKSGDLKAENIVHRVPVQVKGKNDQALLKRKSITYPVEYKHLRNYYRDGGVLYIVVAISDDGEKTTVFYNALSTIKLADLLKGTQDKRADQTKNIVLHQLEKNCSDSLYKVLAQLGVDREKQGGGNGEVAKKAINIGDMDKVDSIQASSFLATNESELIREIVTGEVSLYGHRKDLDMWLPFDYSHQKRIIIRQIIKVDRPIGIDGTNFYDSYLVEGSIELDENLTIKLSENLEIDLVGGKIHFKTIGTLDTLLRDVYFLEALKEGKQLWVNNKTFIDIKNVNIPKSMSDKMVLIEEVDSAFKEIGIHCNKRFDAFTNDNWSKISTLLNIYHRRIKLNEGQDSVWYSWNWDDQIVPILLHRNEDGNIDIINWFATKRYGLFTSSEMKCELPRFVVYKRNVLEKLYDVPEAMWMNEIERVNYSEDNITEILLFFVEVLAAYDITHKEIYFAVAEGLINKLIAVRPEDEYILVNKMQLIKRKEDLSDDYIAKLEEIESKSKNPMIKCAVNILLENKRVAEKLIAEMSEENRNEMMSFPIYSLLQ